mmetsp:Transcript_33803/g.62121  ORF Transcript_33803/g.62121 Transcript_33803/m.62121 type:complete len:254 (+) Transcript_33803:361-1122(+)
MSFDFEQHPTTATTTTTTTTTTTAETSPTPTEESTPSSSTSLIGTSWTAVEINATAIVGVGSSGTDTSDTSDASDPIVIITLSFESDSNNDDSNRIAIYGDTGCNSYRGTIIIDYSSSSSDNNDNDGNGNDNASFETPNEFSLTRMYCGPLRMEREREYIDILRGKVFYYEVIVGSIGENGDAVRYDELVLFEKNDAEHDAAEVEGGEFGGVVAVSARFVRDVVVVLGYDGDGSRDNGSGRKEKARSLSGEEE